MVAIDFGQADLPRNRISFERIFASCSTFMKEQERKGGEKGRREEQETCSGNIVSLTCSPDPPPREIQFYFLLAYRSRPHCGSEFAERARWKRAVFPHSPSILSRPLQCAIFISVGNLGPSPLNNTTGFSRIGNGGETARQQPPAFSRRSFSRRRRIRESIPSNREAECLDVFLIPSS